MITKEEFIGYCDSIIPQEEKDKYNKKRKTFWITLSCVIIGHILLGTLLYFIWSPAIWLVLASMIIASIIIIATMRYKWNDFKKKYANRAFDCLLKGYNHSFSPDHCIGRAIFNASGFASTNYDNYSGEDLLGISIPNDDGSPSGVELNICDLYITRKEERTVRVRNTNGTYTTKTEKYTVTVYNEAFGYIRFPFQFKCDLGLNHHQYQTKRNKLEDINFNKLFKVYTDNQLEALVILTPSLIDRLIKFQARLGKFKLSIRQNGMMYLSIPRNLFKLKTFRQKPNGKVFSLFYDDVADLLLLVDEIKNNNKVFKM